MAGFELALEALASCVKEFDGTYADSSRPVDELHRVLLGIERLAEGGTLQDDAVALAESESFQALSDLKTLKTRGQRALEKVRPLWELENASLLEQRLVSQSVAGDSVENQHRQSVVSEADRKKNMESVARAKERAASVTLEDCQLSELYASSRGTREGQWRRRVLPKPAGRSCPSCHMLIPTAQRIHLEDPMRVVQCGFCSVLLASGDLEDGLIE